MSATIDKIISFEQGELDTAEVIILFAELIKTGLAWQLQGYYGRTAFDLIESGWITRDGEIIRDLADLAAETDDDLGDEIVTVIN